MYPDNLTTGNNTYEVIELDHSDDETTEFIPDVSAFLAPMNDITKNVSQYQYSEEASSTTKVNEVSESELTIQRSLPSSVKDLHFSFSPTNSHVSSQSSPLTKPILATKNSNDLKTIFNGTTDLYSEVTIQPLPSTSLGLKRSPDHSITNNIKRKPFTTLTSVNSDPIELYCLSLVDCFRAMPRSERERVKFEFAKILKDANYKDQL